MRRHRASALGAPHSALLVHLALATAAVAAPRTVAPQVGTRQVTTPLRVLRTLPSGDAAPTAAITVIFDRPVAPALERTMNPAQVVRIEPAVAGRYEWRDPITIRFRPTQAMRAGERYTVTVAGAVRGVDGSTLAAPHRFTFRVRGPELLGMSVAGEGNRGRYLGAAPRFVFVYSAPVDLPAFAAAVKLAPSGACAGLAPVTMRALEQRRTTERDSIASYYGSWYGRRGARADPRLDSLRRRIELAPAAALPPGCDVTLTAPRGMIGVAGAGSRENIPLRTFRTRGPFRIAGVECAGGGIPCPVGPLIVRFTMPVRGSEVRRHVRTAPAVPFTIADTMMETEIWPLPGRFAPRTTYRVVADGAMRDVFGQRVNAAASSASVITSGYPPSVSYASGPLLATRGAPRSIAVRHVNVDTLLVTVAPVPRALEAQLATRGYARYPDSIIARLRAAPVRKVPVSARRDEVVVTHVPIVPSAPTSGATGATMLAVIVTRVGDTSRTRALAPIATIQFSDLAIHSRLGAEQGVVWITGVEDGRARDGVHVSLRDATGLAVASATTDAAGLARLDYRGRWDGVDSRRRVAFSTVSAERGDDRAVSSADLWSYGELSPGALGATAEWGSGRFPMAGAVFTERGIYRPGEMVHAKAIVRDGSLGSLAVPERGELVRFRVRTERADSAIADTVTALGAFGTAEFGMTLPASAPLGRYTLLLERKRNDEWLALASARYDVSEYRAPEFSVGWDASAGPRFAGDTLRSALTARYLFGGAMGGAAVSWAARQDPLPAGELRIPGVAGYYVGINDWFGVRERPREERMLGSGAGTLDSAGRIHVTVPLPDSTDGLPSRLVLEATVTDVNRQSVAARTTLRVEPADFYIAARPAVGNAFWTAGAPQRIEMLVVRPNGERVGSVALAAVVTRRDWRYDAAGGPYGGRWVTDTVARCAVVSALEPVSCTVTPDRAGSYVVQLSARDGRGRVARTSFVRWVVGGGATLAWWGQSRFKMNVIANREDEYRVGDTATVVVFSPFADAEAWVTVEREAIIEQRRLRLPAGQTTLRFPITEAYAPNVLVSAFVTRGAAGARDTADRRIAAGYVALRVAPDPKRLAVRVAPLAAEYRPADSARIRVEVRGSRGEGERAEVALWAVDEGVLSLT
ncbi:MAG: MG2 domain-containing protein, partial [Gemmatimonadaceae bacterium]